MLSPSHIFIHFIHTTILCSGYFCPYFIDEAAQVKSLVQGHEAASWLSGHWRQGRPATEGRSLWAPFISFSPFPWSSWSDGTPQPVGCPCRGPQAVSHFREPSCSHISGFSDPEVQPLIQEQSLCRRARLGFLVLSLILSCVSWGLTPCWVQDK